MSPASLHSAGSRDVLSVTKCYGTQHDAMPLVLASISPLSPKRDASMPGALHAASGDKHVK